MLLEPTPEAKSNPRRTMRLPRASTRKLPHRLGRYTAFDHIGRGGMADIYLARAHSELGASRLVVIKEVLPDLAHNALFADMLVSEAKLAARLSHANVVQVADLGREDGALFIAMEYVEGLDLRELLRRCAKGKVALPIEFSLRIVTEVLKALDYAHRHRDETGAPRGLVHRDVSPSNVLISLEGEVKLCDFGIARANPLADAASDETIQGKAGYMSPEHARGDVLDGRADVFAAGIILWELLAGKRLYKAWPGETLIEVARRAEIPALERRELPFEGELHALVARALEVDRAARFATAAAMRDALEAYAAKARMMASPLRFGEWVMSNFGAEVVRTRRARERVMEALERGPAVVIEPIVTPREATLTPTPSTVFVCERAEGGLEAKAGAGEGEGGEPLALVSRGEGEQAASPAPGPEPRPAGPQGKPGLARRVSSRGTRAAAIAFAFAAVVIGLLACFAGR